MTEKRNNNVFSMIWNGIKRAVKFVFDVLLFIPRVIFRGLKSILCKESPKQDDSNYEKFFEEEITVSSKSESAPTQKETNKENKSESAPTQKETNKENKSESAPTQKETNKENKSESAPTQKATEQIITPDKPQTQEEIKESGFKVVSKPGEPLVTTPVDTDLPEGFAVKTSERKVAAEETDTKVSVTPEITETAINSKSAPTQKLEKVEAEIVSEPIAKENPESNDAIEMAFDDTSYGRHELDCINLILYKVSNPMAIDVDNNFLHPHDWSMSFIEAAKHFIWAVSERYGYVPDVAMENFNMAQKDERASIPAKQRLNFIKSKGIISDDSYNLLSLFCANGIFFRFDAHSAWDDTCKLHEMVKKYIAYHYNWYHHMKHDQFVEIVNKYTKQYNCCTAPLLLEEEAA